MGIEIYLKGKIENGQIVPLNPDVAHDHLIPLEGDEIIIGIEKYHKRRSDGQNRWYWGIAIQKYIIPFLEATEGTVYTKEEIHAYHLSKVADSKFSWKEICGQQVLVFEEISTRKMNTKEFKEYAMKIQEHWRVKTDGELLIPDPNQTNFLNDDFFTGTIS